MIKSEEFTYFWGWTDSADGRIFATVNEISGHIVEMFRLL